MADLLNRVKLALIALLSAMGLCVVLAGVTWAEEQPGKEQAQDAVRYPDVWCRTVPLTGQGLALPGSMSSVYLDPQNHPIIVYVLRLPGDRAAVRYYDFFTDQVIGEYESHDDKTPDGADAYTREQEIKKRHNLREIKDFLYSRIDDEDYTRTIKGGGHPDGGQLRRTHGSSMYPIGVGLQKIDAQGLEVFDAMVILSTPGLQLVQNVHPENEFWQYTNFSLIHSRSIYPKVYDLLDGTYLLTGSTWPGLLRVRLDDDLEAPCLGPVVNSVTGKLDSQLMVVDAAWARDLYEEAVVRADKQRQEHPELNLHPVVVVDRYVTKALKNRLKTAGK